MEQIKATPITLSDIEISINGVSKRHWKKDEEGKKFLSSPQVSYLFKAKIGVIDGFYSNDYLSDENGIKYIYTGECIVNTDINCFKFKLPKTLFVIGSTVNLV